MPCSACGEEGTDVGDAGAGPPKRRENPGEVGVVEWSESRAELEAETGLRRSAGARGFLRDESGDLSKSKYRELELNISF